MPTITDGPIAITCRAGANLSAQFRWLDASRVPIDTTGYRAVMTIRPAWTTADADPLFVLESDGADPRWQPHEEDGWQLEVPGSETEVWPTRSRFEVEIQNEADEDDVRSIASGVVTVVPQVWLGPA